MPTEEEPKFAGKCPECGAATTMRKSKKGKVYYSCSSYPACKFMSWDLPTGEKCPTCGDALVTTLRGNIKCNNKDCSYKIKTETKQGEKKAKTIPLSEDFDAPPLMEEPQYLSGGYIYEGADDES
jgi:ssDNA-binding Zn-finger/Zn-ribbon topoisomerase 1